MQKIVYDPVLKRPGCVLLQAAMGGDAVLAHRFDPGCWLLAPTPDMRLFPVSDEQLDKLIAFSQQNN